MGKHDLTDEVGVDDLAAVMRLTHRAAGGDWQGLTINPADTRPAAALTVCFRIIAPGAGHRAIGQHRSGMLAECGPRPLRPVWLDYLRGNCLLGPGAALLTPVGLVGKAATMRGVRFLVVLAGAGVLAAGCGTTVAQAAGLAAAAAHTAGQSARIAVTTTMRTGGMSVSFTETGVFDFARSRGMVSMHKPVGMTEIFLPPKTYIKIPGGVHGPLPHGKSWVAIDAGASAAPVSSLLGPFGGGTDPAGLLASLTAVSRSVTKLGATTIRGVRVTGYRVAIDPVEAAARLPHRERAGVLGFAKLLGPGAIPVQVWVDGQNLVRRAQLSLHPPSGEGAPPGAGVVQVTDFYDFGVPVRVSAPPAAQVASMPTFLKAGPPGSVSIGRPARPPRVSGTLPPAQAAAAEQVAGAFWSALGRNDPAAVAQTVPPAQRSCVRSLLTGGPKITVTSFRVVSAQPAGSGRATVRFTVKARASLGGHNIPVFPQGPGRVQWLVAAETAGRWYVDLAHSGAFLFGGACP